MDYSLWTTVEALASSGLAASFAAQTLDRFQNIFEFHNLFPCVMPKDESHPDGRNSHREDDINVP